jgi:hypothetical protein
MELQDGLKTITSGAEAHVSVRSLAAPFGALRLLRAG